MGRSYMEKGYLRLVVEKSGGEGGAGRNIKTEIGSLSIMN